MKRKQKIALGVMVAAISAVTFLGVGMASANESGDNLVAKIASKFNLNQTEVQAVFDEFHTEERANMETKRSDDLQAKVDAGTITAEQKTLIENKLKEMDAEREANKDQSLTREEMQAKMQTSREALKTWATENGIDESLIMPMGVRGGGRGEGGPRMGQDS
jgi:hypothetical protein